MNIGSLLPWHARFRGDRTALVGGERTLSYRQLNADVNRLASALLAAGLGKGDKLTTVLGNGLELMAAYWAAAQTGFVIVPASPLLQEGGWPRCCAIPTRSCARSRLLRRDPRPHPARAAGHRRRPVRLRR